MTTHLAASLSTPLSYQTVLALQSQVARWMDAPADALLSPGTLVLADVGRAGSAFRRAQHELASVGLAAQAVHVHLSRSSPSAPAWQAAAHDVLVVQLFGSNRWSLPVDCRQAPVTGARPAPAELALCVGHSLVVAADTPHGYRTPERVISVHASFDLGRSISEKFAGMKAGPLSLRVPQVSDAEAVHRLLADGRVAPTTSTLPLAYAPHHAQAWLAQAVPATRPPSLQRLVVLADGQVVGAISCQEIAPRVGHVAYWIGADHWGCGFAGEAVRQLVAELRAQGAFDRLEARHLDTHVPSGKVLLRNGFVRTGCKRMPWRGGAERWIDEYVLDLTRQ